MIQALDVWRFQKTQVSKLVKLYGNIEGNTGEKFKSCPPSLCFPSLNARFPSVVN